MFCVFQYQAVKRKLQSKNDALVILAKDLTECQGERDQYKMMADQLRHKCQNLKKQLQADKVSSSNLISWFKFKVNENGLVRLLYAFALDTWA